MAFLRGWFAATILYCLFVAPAFADEMKFKPYPLNVFCSEPERFDEVLKSIRENGEGEGIRLLNFYAATGLCLYFPRPVMFLGEKVVREYGDLSDLDLGKGNVVIEGVIIGTDAESKVYIWTDDDYLPDMLLGEPT